MKIPLLDCAKQPWWRKLWMNDPYHYSQIDACNAALKKYNARITNESHLHSHLVFDTEQDYVMFVLRWS